MVDWEIIPDRTARVVRHYIANLPVTIGTSGTAGTGCWTTHPGGPLSPTTRNPARLVPLMAL